MSWSKLTCGPCPCSTSTLEFNSSHLAHVACWTIYWSCTSAKTTDRHGGLVTSGGHLLASGGSVRSSIGCGVALFLREGRILVRHDGLLLHWRWGGGVADVVARVRLLGLERVLLGSVGWV
jgi:hypothetical protein